MLQVVRFFSLCFHSFLLFAKAKTDKTGSSRMGVRGSVKQGGQREIERLRERFDSPKATPNDSSILLQSLPFLSFLVSG